MSVQYLVSILTLGCITAILVLGVNVRWGMAGELDLGFYLFPAVGAYVYGVVTLPKPNALAGETYIFGFNQSFFIGLIAAVIVGGLLSLLLGAVALRRLRANYFAIVTVATTIIGYSFISQYKPLFNGYNGLYAVPQPFSGVLHLTVQGYSNFFFAICAVGLVIVYVLLEMIRRSPFGRAVKAVREDETAALAFGRSPYQLRLKAYVIGGVVGAFGGALLVNYVQSYSPAAWSALETFLLYGALLVGGTGNNLGGVVGAFLVLIVFTQLVLQIPTSWLPNTDALPALENIFIGLMIVLTLYFRPGGLIPELPSMNGQLWTKGRRNRRVGRSEATEGAVDVPAAS